MPDDSDKALLPCEVEDIDVIADIEDDEPDLIDVGSDAEDEDPDLLDASAGAEDDDAEYLDGQAEVVDEDADFIEASVEVEDDEPDQLMAVVVVVDESNVVGGNDTPPLQAVNVAPEKVTPPVEEAPKKAALKVKVSKKLDPAKASKREVTAKLGDCLCGIAAEAGLLNCQPLRDLPENAGLLKRDLKAGDVVTLPPDPEKLFEDATVTVTGPESPAGVKTLKTGIADLGRLTPGEYTIKVVLKDADLKHFAAPAEHKHTLAADDDHTEPFEVEALPIGPLNIRMVHGGSAVPGRDEEAISTLNVSSFVTNLGGADGLKPFPTAYGFSDDAHQDPDTFKVEIWDPLADGDVNVKLEALKPVYAADGDSGNLKPTSFTPFVGDGRVIDAAVARTTGKDTFRSKYMRLVVDEADRDAAGFAGQLLFVSDLADGLGTGAEADNDSVEILDQQVRATYQPQRCAAADKCKIDTTAEIGGAERQRVRVRFSAFRSAPGVDTMPTGVTGAVIKQHLRRRTYKWYRRVFAQANMAPKLESVTVVDPPAENMLCLSHSHGNSVTAASEGAFDRFIASVRLSLTDTGAYTLVFRIKTATKDVRVNVEFVGGETPAVAAGMIVGKIPSGFVGEAHACPQPGNALNASYDVLVNAANGERVTLLDVVLSPGAGMTVAVPRVDLMNVLSGDADTDMSASFLSIDMKRILRAVPITDDAMYCVVVGQFSTPSLRGQAFMPGLGADAKYRPELPFRSSTIMAYTSTSGPVLDGGDNLPFTSPHESCHTLCDLVHSNPRTNHSRTELMGTGTSKHNTITATKRLSKGPYTVQMQKNGTTTMSIVNVKLAETMRDGSVEKWEPW